MKPKGPNPDRPGDSTSGVQTLAPTCPLSFWCALCDGGDPDRTLVEVRAKAFVATGNPKQSEEIIVYLSSEPSSASQ